MSTKDQKLVIAGGAGFLGRVLSRWFVERGWEVTVLTRRSPSVARTVREVHWDGMTMGDWRRELEGASAIVNLAGRSVNCRYTTRHRREILLSRVDSTRVIGDAISACAHPPRVWLNSSTATIYKHSFDQAMDEATGVIAATPAAKDAFSIEVAQAWERAALEANVPSTRTVLLRTAMVLGLGEESVFGVLRRLARCGLGGAMAGGAQYVSWIHEDDFCRAIEWLIDHDTLSGPVNIAAPVPVTNRELMRLFRAANGVRLGLPATRTMLELGAVALRTETELIIKSRRVVPGRLLETGFAFGFPEVAGALAELESRLAAAH